MRRWQHTGAFVIRFRQDTETGTGQFSGRVEHVASCTSTRFESIDELLDFLTETLASLEREAQSIQTNGDGQTRPEITDLREE